MVDIVAQRWEEWRVKKRIKGVFTFISFCPKGLVPEQLTLVIPLLARYSPLSYASNGVQPPIARVQGPIKTYWRLHYDVNRR